MVTNHPAIKGGWKEREREKKSHKSSQGPSDFLSSPGIAQLPFPEQGPINLSKYFIVRAKEDDSHSESVRASARGMDT